MVRSPSTTSAARLSLLNRRVERDKERDADLSALPRAGKIYCLHVVIVCCQFTNYAKLMCSGAYVIKGGGQRSFGRPIGAPGHAELAAPICDLAHFNAMERDFILLCQRGAVDAARGKRIRRDEITSSFLWNADESSCIVSWSA